MTKHITDLQKRKEHFQWVAKSLDAKEKEVFIEKDWYDSPTLISREVAQKEVEQIEFELLQEEKSKKGFWKSMLQLFQRLWC